MTNVTDASMGRAHGGLLYLDGSVKLFGANTQGQCDMGLLRNDRIISISFGSAHSALL